MAVDLRILALDEKNLLLRPRWVEVNSTSLNLTAVLDFASGETIEGLELRACASQSLPDRAVRIMLLHFPPKGQCNQLGRVEWRPLGVHTNPNKGPEHLRMLQIKGSHVHGFEMNWLEEDKRLRQPNLPIAEPLHRDPSNFQELLEFVGEVFRIKGLEKIEAPPWREADFFGV